MKRRVLPDQGDQGILLANYTFSGYPYDGTPRYTPGSVDDVPPWNYFFKVTGVVQFVFDVGGSLTNRYEVMS
jgi:hypothetical protein